MQVAVETTNGLERRIKIAIPAERIDQEINSRLQKLSRTAKLDGFRKGKIPLTVIDQRFRPAVQFEVLDDLMRKTLTEALQQEKINPAGISKLEPQGNYEIGKAFSYSALLEVYPEIKLKPFTQLEVEKTVATVNAEDVEKTIENMRKQQITWQVTESAAAEGDRVTIDFAGTIDGVAFDGGTGKDMAVVIGSKNTIAGFEEGLKKTKTGQSTSLNLTFPENYHAKELAGKPVVFAVTVNKVEKPVLPELNDEFAVKFGVKEGGLAKLREEVTNTLNQQLQQQLRTRTKNQIMKKIIAAYADVEIPKALIHREAENMAREMQERFKQFGQQQAKPEMFKTELFETQAKERVSLGLVINEIVKQHALKPEADKVRKLIEQFAQSYQDPEEVVRWYYRQKDRLAEMEYLALEEQVVDIILVQAKLTEKTVSASDIFNAGEANV